MRVWIFLQVFFILVIVDLCIYNKNNNNSLAHLVDSPNLMVNWTKKLAENDLPNGLEKYEVMHHLLIWIIG